MNGLGLMFGAIVGLSLGLTGGGGAIFAVPLLVYGLGVPTREAVGISLAAVGATSLVGFLMRWRNGQVDLKTGAIFALAGMVGAPAGAWASGFIPEPLLLTLFGGLMVIVALRMWRQTREEAQIIGDVKDADSAATCRRDAAGTLLLTTRCTWLMIATGTMAGVLSGLFGVGGGFVIVPALVLFSGMPIHRAVGTSLMVIALVSVSGVVSFLAAGRPISPIISTLFVVGGIVGLFAGQKIGRRLTGPALQRLFVVAILAVATFVIARNLAAGSRVSNARCRGQTATVS